MKFGISLPNFGRDASKENLIRMALTAENYGFDSIWLSDHIVIPVSHRGFGNTFYESLVTLSYLSSLTTIINLGTSVLIIPYRNPYELANVISTIDNLSGGRLILGIGTGWMKDEFYALGSDYMNRSALTDEYIKIMLALWTDRIHSSRAQSSETSGFTVKIEPLQKTHPPLWIGGNSSGSIERAITFGNGWHAVGLTPLEVNKLIPFIKDQINTKKNIYNETKEFVISLRKNLQITKDERIESNYSETLRGSKSKITEGLIQYAKTGVSYIILQILAGSFEEVMKNLKILHQDIIKYVDHDY